MSMAMAILGPACGISTVEGCSNSSYILQASFSHKPSAVCRSSDSASPSLRRLGLSYLNSWSGRSHLGEVQLLKQIAGRQSLSKRVVAGRVHASLLGVGAPEALVIAVVALLVFGPKGLAEVARTLGRSLRAFQPTIQELQQVSREFRSTLEQEIGLDELRNPTSPPPRSEQAPFVQMPQELQQPPEQTPQNKPPSYTQGPPEDGAYTSEDYVRVTAEQAKALVPEDLRKEAEKAAWGGSVPTKSVENKENLVSVKEDEKKGEEVSS